VRRRLRAALTSLAASVGTEERREKVLRYLRRLDSGVGGSAFDDEDTANSLRQDRQGLGLSRGRDWVVCPRWWSVGIGPPDRPAWRCVQSSIWLPFRLYFARTRCQMSESN